MKSMKIDKSQLIGKLDAEPVPLNYKAKQGEHTFIGYLWGFAPIKYKSKTITQEIFDEMCE